jgi:hypothetical protein
MSFFLSAPTRIHSQNHRIHSQTTVFIHGVAQRQSPYSTAMQGDL